MSSPDPTDLLPLSTPMLHVLLALGNEQLHGYAIMQAIQEKTGGEAKILPGTLYTTLNRMMEADLVAEVADPPPEAAEDKRRRYYRVTAFGKQVVQAESRRMSMLLDVARRERLVG